MQWSRQCLVFVMFLVGVWVGYSCLQLRDYLPMYIQHSTASTKLEKENWTNKTIFLANLYSGNNDSTLICSANESISEFDPVWLSLRWMEDSPPVVFYNRVPKTGSSVTLAVIKDLAKKNKFRKITSNVNILFNMTIPAQEGLVQGMYRFPPPVIYDRHAYFIDFTEYGQPQPMYINTVRDPIPHFLSFYYYMRKMSQWKNRYTVKQRGMTLDKCLNISLYNCEPHRQLRFFCGQSAICNLPDPPEGALQLAKRNIERHYSVVGINEDLQGFFQLLEVFVPRFFSKAGSTYLKHKNDYKGFTTKKMQAPLEANTNAKLEEILKYDYDLYNFVKQRLHKQHCIKKQLLKHRAKQKALAKDHKK